jgi:hypothetical protein
MVDIVVQNAVRRIGNDILVFLSIALGRCALVYMDVLDTLDDM